MYIFGKLDINKISSIRKFDTEFEIHIHELPWFPIFQHLHFSQQDLAIVKFVLPVPLMAQVAEARMLTKKSMQTSLNY